MRIIKVDNEVAEDFDELEMEAIGAHADRVEDAVFSTQEDFLNKLIAKGWSRKEAMDEWLRIEAEYPKVKRGDLL